MSTTTTTTTRPATTPTIDAARAITGAGAYWLTAADRLRTARHAAADPGTAYTESGETIRYTDPVDGFDVVITHTYDDYNDIDHLGSFDDDADDDAVSNYGADSRGHHYADAKYFHPANPARVNAAYMNARGMSRGEAWRRATAAVYADRNYARTYTAYVVTVTASREGVALGNASIGGYTFAEEWPTADELIDAAAGYDLIGEAVDDAAGTVAAITPAAAPPLPAYDDVDAVDGCPLCYGGTLAHDHDDAGNARGVVVRVSVHGAASDNRLYHADVALFDDVDTAQRYAETVAYKAATAR